MLTLVTSLCIIQFTLKEQIIGIYSSDAGLQERAIDVIWIMSLSTFPDLYKALGRGIAKATGLQREMVVINLIGSYGVNALFIWLLAFHYDMQCKGLLLAKLAMEIYLCVGTFVTIGQTDW